MAKISGKFVPVLKNWYEINNFFIIVTDDEEEIQTGGDSDEEGELIGYVDSFFFSNTIVIITKVQFSH